MSQEEINQIRQLVEEAYREGYSDGAAWGWQWPQSQAKKKLETIEVQHESRDSTKATAKDI